jgi:hypothetical protein
VKRSVEKGLRKEKIEKKFTSGRQGGIYGKKTAN